LDVTALYGIRERLLSEIQKGQTKSEKTSIVVGTPHLSVASNSASTLLLDSRPSPKVVTDISVDGRAG